MPLLPGARLGPYEITGAIGAGGMGEVYRARDTRLDRDVAIKVLPELFVNDPDRLSRFEREARALASLNHPHVAQIYGIEAEGNVHALAMEFVDGEDLAARISRGAIPVADALPIARQIADALAAAHDRGIIHRDLKPANVRMRDDGTVKVLDFGLAKAVDSINAPPITNSPTFTSPAHLRTEMGVILGTAAYMSPEQAKGKGVDRGSDMWSFGALFFEMLSGTSPFEGETVTDVLAAIVMRDPDWNLLPATTPPAIRRLLHRCLERDRRKRLADAGEARFQIEEALSSPVAQTAPINAAPVAPSRRAPTWQRVLPWGAAALLAVALVALGTRAWREPVVEAARFNIEAPPRAVLSLASRPALAISPDGKTLVFVATTDGVDRLYVRHIGSYEISLLPGTDGASHPAISPDGRSVAFVTATRLSHMPLAGGPVMHLGKVDDPRGVSWDEQDSIVYTPGPVGGVMRIPAGGGTPVQVTTTRGEHRAHPPVGAGAAGRGAAVYDWFLHQSR